MQDPLFGLTPEIIDADIFLLEWLSLRDSSALGECQGSHLDRLLGAGIAQVLTDPTKPPEYSRVTLTPKGWRLYHTIKNLKSLASVTETRPRADGGANIKMHHYNIQGTTMRVKMKSQHSGKEHVMDLPITIEQWNEWQTPDRRLIQDVFPQLNSEQREFLLTGITPEEWKEIFPPDEEDGNEKP
jgi:hypothetical protein